MNTLMNLSISNSIFNFVKNHIVLFDSFDNVYLFGSILNENKIADDIDLLLIYSNYSNRILNDLNQISSVLEDEYGLPVDFTVLSIEEEKNTEFLKKIFPIYLKLK